MMTLKGLSLTVVVDEITEPIRDCVVVDFFAGKTVIVSPEALSGNVNISRINTAVSAVNNN